MCTCMMMIKSGALFFFLFGLLTTVQSSTLPFKNITIGSSIYASSSSYNQTSYWLSPSGVFAFGFYPLCYNCDQYKVAIWINKPSNKVVVVWSDNNNEQPIYSGSSIQLSPDGVFTIQLADSTTKPLFNSTLGPAAYGLMQDNGNFVIYNSDSNIVWQSFDHPTDTILQGQTLKPDVRLVVPITGQKLIMQKYGNLELLEIRQHNTGDKIIVRKYGPQIIEKGQQYLSEDIIWQSKTRKDDGGVVLNLDSIGRMYLVDKDGIVIKKLTKDKEHNKGSNGTRSLETTIHRATLESDGVFRLYAEKIGWPPITHESKNSVLLWESYCKKCHQRIRTMIIAMGIGVFLLAFLLEFLLLMYCC